MSQTNTSTSDSPPEVSFASGVLEITEKGAVIRHNDGQNELAADSIVLAVGLEANSGFQEKLQGKVSEVYAIGDCVRPRKVLDAIWEGFRIARLI